MTFHKMLQEYCRRSKFETRQGDFLKLYKEIICRTARKFELSNFVVKLKSHIVAISPSDTDIYKKVIH